MSVKSNDKYITLLVHSKFAAFDWGKIFIDTFAEHAVKGKYTLCITHDARQIERKEAPIVMMGVDSVWLGETLACLGKRNSHIILINDAAYCLGKHINRICTDQRDATEKCMELLAENKRNHPAYFGVQNNDSSDRVKEVVFSEKYSADDIYKVDDDIKECCDRLLDNIDAYDSVICANDAMAIYFLGRCKSRGIQIPENIQLIGNGNIWLGKHVTPPITTVTYNTEALVKMALQLCRNLCETEEFGTVNVLLSGRIIQRESTGAPSEKEDVYIHRRSSYFVPDDETVCRELLPIVKLDRVLSTCSEEFRSIIRLLSKGFSISQIAEQNFLSQDTVKYHVKKLYRQLDIHSRKELSDIIDTYGIKL